MSPATLSFARLLALALAVSTVSAQKPEDVPPEKKFPKTPLAELRFPDYPNGLPYQADTNVGLIRGTQYGYNRCNSTTEGQASKCQTSIVNSIDDFCLWGPPEPNSVVADHEGEMVAWCTKPGRGTRLIPRDALKGVQFMKTPAYVQVVGFIDQTKINIAPGDYGGEMDPHGADLRGNPMGGLIYSNAFTPDANRFVQVIEWHNFMGGDAFCIKACDPSNPDAAHFCEHKLDRIGCAYNAPNNAKNGTFESCKGDNQAFPGVYTENGQVMTYTQPPEALGAITTMPYTAVVPASSECVQYTSSVLYAALASVTAPGSAPTATPSASGSSGAASGTAKPSNSASGTSGGAKPTSTSNDATAVAVGGVATVLGVVFSALFLA